jgi:hypothetical protein
MLDEQLLPHRTKPTIHKPIPITIPKNTAGTSHK